MAFNEDTRVKIPALLHLIRLGYKYISLKDAKWDETTNIFTNIFAESIERINSNSEDIDITKELAKITLLLDNEDLGEGFYKALISTFGTKAIERSLLKGENPKLVILRDWILPKLMNWQIKLV